MQDPLGPPLALVSCGCLCPPRPLLALVLFEAHPRRVRVRCVCHVGYGAVCCLSRPLLGPRWWLLQQDSAHLDRPQFGTLFVKFSKFSFSLFTLLDVSNDFTRRLFLWFFSCNSHAGLGTSPQGATGLLVKKGNEKWKKNGAHTNRATTGDYEQPLRLKWCVGVG